MKTQKNHTKMIGHPDREERRKVKLFAEQNRPDLTKKKAVKIPEINATIFVDPSINDEEAKKQYLHKVRLSQKRRDLNQ